MMRRRNATVLTFWRTCLAAFVFLANGGYSESSEFVPRSGLGSSDPRLLATPEFIREPDEYYYIVRNIPIEVVCEATSAVQIKFRCAGVNQDHEITTERYDQKRNKKVLVSRLEVTRDEVNDYFGEDGYWCECTAHNKILGTNENKSVKSGRGIIEMAYLRRRFEREPMSVRVALEATAQLECLPPDGRPLPEVYWLKDGKEIDVRKNNLVISSEGNLLFSQARLSDTANYTCGARNVLTKRLSHSAVLTVYVNGSWSTWSQWSECSAKCGKGTQRRTRSCSNPSPLNGGAPCGELTVQKVVCQSICPDGTYVVVDGSWSQWSSWSTCSPDCLHHRRRSCDSPQPSNGGSYCHGNDLDTYNCTGGMCRDKTMYTRNGQDHPTKEATTSKTNDKEDITMYIGVCVAIAVLAIVVVIIVIVIRRKSTNHDDAGQPSLTDEEKKANKNANGMVLVPPDLTQTVVTVQHPNNRVSRSPSMEAPNNNHSSVENIYDKPNFKPEHRLSGTLTKNSKTMLVEPTLNMKDKTMAVPPVPPGPRPPLPRTNDSVMDSRQSMMSVQLPGNIDLEEVAWSTFNHHGGRLVLPESGIVLTVPEGAIKKGQMEELFLAVCRDDKDRPKLSDRQTVISPVILCGPNSPGMLKKPVILSFQHCANMRQGGWMLSIFASSSPLDEAPYWKKVVTLGQETINTPLYAQLDPNHCHIVTEHLQRYALIGEAVQGGNKPVKILRLAAFAPCAPPSMDYSIRVYVVEDTQDALEGVIQEEKKYGGRLLDKPKQIPFQDGGHNLCLTIEELSAGWRSKLAANYQEIPFQHIWSGTQNNLHCSFSLELGDRSVDKISCKIQVYQKAILSNRQVLNIHSNIHSNFKEKSASCSTPSSTLKGRSSTVTTNSSSGFSSMLTLDPACQNFRLPPHIRNQLCMLLDPPNVRGNDWRMLAQALTVDRYVQFFATKNSPTDHILDLWEARHREESAITDLMNIFRVMGRLDAAAVIEKDMGSWL